MAKNNIKEKVKEGYGKIAQQGSSCCESTPSCCETSDQAENISRNIGYSDQEMQAVPDGSNLGLGCGNPVALASLKPGETVLDLGSGAGFDCFLAANRVGNTGKVIGIDMTPEMIAKARDNAQKGDYANVEFRLGEIENIPVEDNLIDIIISNCVINLSPDKDKVFKEAFRVLKAKGRLMVSDIVLQKELPDEIKNSVEAYVGCVAGAMLKADYIHAIKNAGFEEITILEETVFPLDCIVNDPVTTQIIDKMKLNPDKLEDLASSVVSIKVMGRKP